MIVLLLPAIFIVSLLAMMTNLALADSDSGYHDLPPLPEYLMDMSLEQLMDIKVTSVSKRPQKISEAAAAVFVITREELRQ